MLYNKVLSNLNAKFEFMKTKFYVSETLKIHVIKDHFKYYLNQTKKKFCNTNGENLESSHSSLKIHEQRHHLHLTL